MSLVECRAGEGACLVSQPGNLSCRYPAVVFVLPDLVQEKYWVTEIAFSNLSKEIWISPEGLRLAACLLTAPSFTATTAPRRL